jgi:hypothetical protein
MSLSAGKDRTGGDGVRSLRLLTARELAELALERSRQHIERSRAEIEDASGGDWKLLSAAIKLLHEEGGSPEQHVAFTLLHSAMLDVLTKSAQTADEAADDA